MRIDKNDLLILPDEELRAEHKRLKKLRWGMSLPLLLYIALAVLLLPEMAGSTASVGLTGFAAVASGICYSFILADDPATHKKLLIGGLIFQGLLLATITVYALVRDNFSMAFPTFFLTAASAAGNLLARPVIRDLAELRAHPRYPFENWRRDETYTKGLYSADASGGRAVKRIDSTLKQGKVVSGGHEDIFENGKNAPPADEEEVVELLQKQARVWTDESDKTAYIMDNLDKMYFDDGLLNGELVGEELEKQLMKATAPSKPPEPLPEDFFQTQKIVWRPQKHDYSEEEKRSPAPPKPAENKDRTVLM